MKRISMSLPVQLIEEFDEVLKNRKYQSRSKAIRDALKDYIMRHRWTNETTGNKIGVVTIVCDYFYKGLTENLGEIKYEYRNEIRASNNTHINDKYSMELIIIEGNIDIIREFTERVMRLKGVANVKLSSIATGENIDF